MNVLVFNCGSSSLKYRLLAMPEAVELTGGEAQRVGPPSARPSVLLYHIGTEKFRHEVSMPNHAVAFEEVMRLLTQDPRLRPHAVGHRLVHGGAAFRNPTVVDGKVMEELEAIRELAPLHNPPAMALMAACAQRYPALPQVAVFDTAFHSNIPECARTYALPRGLSQELGIRKYGFHGTSHQFVMEEAAAFLGKPVEQFSAVSCHLGSGGASLCAILQGQSIDNTMGYSPLQGLVMSTRCGDLDPAIALKLLAQAEGNGEQVSALLNNKCGVLGLTGCTADIRDVFARESGAQEQDRRAKLAEEVYTWRLRKYLGAYLAVVGRPDAVIFTDTIGETVPQVRWAMCAGMESFGIKMDPARNANVTRYPADLTAVDGPVRVLVIRTNEELAIARRTCAALSGRATLKPNGHVSGPPRQSHGPTDRGPGEPAGAKSHPAITSTCTSKEISA